MKLQAKISLTLIASMFLATALSFVFINIFIVIFDRSYSWYDLDQIAAGAARDLAAAPALDAAHAAETLAAWKARYPRLYFSVVNEKRQLVYASDDRPRRRPEIMAEVARHLREEERRSAARASSPRFVDTIDRSPFMVMKPVAAAGAILGRVAVSVQREYFLPFYIRLNDEKLPDAYLIVFGTIAFIVALSFVLVFIFTSPLVRRLRALYARINGFELGRPVSGAPDPRRDEIGFIRNTFDRMAKRIHEDYEERIRIFRDRQELLRNISHDFRTPLTSILGYAASLEEGVYDDEAEQKKYYSIIRRKAEYMTRLFNEMMELTRLDSDTSLLKTSEFNLGELAREIIIEYLPQLEAAGFEIRTDLPETFACAGDRERLSRALRNLIDNVVTHASGGRFIGVSLEPAESGGRPGVSLDVSDRGPGVAAAERGRVFDRFYTAASGGEEAGSGLGLAITREIVEKHGGTIGLRDNPGGGAVFGIWLPTEGIQTSDKRG
ncbi:MAG: HAMP domain-containing histidine kinase [Spirochaetales bacterium]|nr:HAMP domain-containing histidine kinase [Spirochaetales bacterium]